MAFVCLRFLSRIGSPIKGIRNCTTLKPDRPGAHKTPIVDYLWNLRDNILEQEKVQAQAIDRKKVDRGTDRIIAPKISADSYTSVLYPFSRLSDTSLREKYINPWGKIRVGRVVEDLDALAGTISFKHAEQEGVPKYLIVTASIDRIVLGHRANVKDDIELSGKVSWVGRSSMEIKMQAKSSWTDVPWLSALFTFVALDRETGRPAQLPPLLPNGDEEEKEFKLGQERNELRKQLKKENTSNIIRQRRKGIMIEHEHEPDRKVTFEEAADELFREAQQLLDLPSLAPRDTIPISKTRLVNAMIMQPQQKNTSGRIFGGFLVRRAYELAFSTAYMYGGCVPRLDEVVFRSPIDVGNLVRFTSCVLYTSTAMHQGVPTAHIEVVASVIRPENISSTISNTFNFTFEFPEADKLNNVLPETRDDALRIVARFQNDLYQIEEDTKAKSQRRE